MAKLPMDLSKFKKVMSDAHSTTMRNHLGHEVRIAHSALSPKMRGELAALPTQNYADGGEAEAPVPSDEEGPSEYIIAQRAAHQGLAKGEYKGYGSISKEQQTAKYVPPAPPPKQETHQEKMAGLQKGAGFAKGGKVQNFAEGTPDAPVSDSVSDSPDQIAADARASAPQPAAIAPELTAKRGLYNQQVQAMSNIPGDPQEQNRIKSSQFGPNGEPPANFNVDAWNKASTDYGASQDAETAAKAQATQGLIKTNESRVAAGLDPLPVTADDATSVAPTSTAPSQDVPATPQTPPDAAIPGDKEFAAVQNGKQAVNASMPAGASKAQMTPADTAQALVGAKQMSYDALMQERRRILSSMTDVKPETMSHIFADKSLPGKFAMLAGLFLGGQNAAAGSGPNSTLAVYQNMIDNDLKAQQLNLGKKQSLLANNLALTGDIAEAVKLSKVNMMDYQMHQLVKLASKYPNNQQIQDNLKMLGMMGAQSSSNIMDSLAATTAWRHSVSEIKDPAQKIQFNPIMTPEQKNEAFKQLGTFQNMNTIRNNMLNAFDQVDKMYLAGAFSPQKRNALLEPLLAQAVKDSEGRITPQDVPMIGALLPAGKDMGKDTRILKRAQLAKFMSSKMNFPMLSLAGIDASTPAIGGIQSGPPKLGK